MKQIIKPNIFSEFLGREYINTKFFIFDNWMFIHFFSGIVLGFFLKKWWIVLSLLIIYEIFEFFLWGMAFKQEGFVNIFWDILFGMVGFTIIRRILRF